MRTSRKFYALGLTLLAVGAAGFLYFRANSEPASDFGVLPPTSDPSIEGFDVKYALDMCDAKMKSAMREPKTFRVQKGWRKMDSADENIIIGRGFSAKETGGGRLQAVYQCTVTPAGRDIVMLRYMDERTLSMHTVW